MRTPHVGPHAHLLGDLQQHVELAHLLDDDEHLVAEALAHEREAHELLVLVSVADDQVVGALAQREHGLQLRLGPALEADARRLAELDDLLDDVPLLVDLDRVHGGVAAVVRELVDGGAELRVQRLDPDRRMSEKRSSTGRVTPCASRSLASSNRSSARSG